MNATYVSVLSQSILDNSPGGASLLHPNAAAALGTPGLAALLVAYILPVCALLAPCHPGAALRDLCNESLLRDTSDPHTEEEAGRPGWPLLLRPGGGWGRRDHVERQVSVELGHPGYSPDAAKQL